MKKRIIALAACILMVATLLAGCARESKNKAGAGISISEPNYNHVVNGFNALTRAAKEDFVYYGWNDMFYSETVTAVKDGEKEHILTGLSFKEEYYDGEFFVLGDYAYFRTSVDDFGESPEDEIRTTNKIYKLDLKTNEYESIYSADDMDIWMITEEFIVYSSWIWPEEDVWEDPYRTQNLSLYSFEDKKVSKVSDYCEAYCIVEGKLRFVNYYEGEYHLFEYDHKKAELSEIGSFKSEKSDDNVYTYNFTSEGVLVSLNYAQTVLFYNAEKDEATEYEVPCVYEWIAGDKYAYGYCDSGSVYYEESDGEGPTCAVYRLELATGKTDLIKYDSEINDMDAASLSIYVASDDDIYIEEGEMKSMLLYRITVYHYDVKEKTTKKLFYY